MALTNGFHSVACFPLTDRNHHYGFFEVYGEKPGLFADEEVAVLEELAAHIGNAISAVQRKEALLSGHSISLEFEIESPDDPLFELAATADCSLTVEALAPHRDDSWLVYVALEAENPDSVLETARESTHITDANLVDSSGGAALLALVASTLTVPSVISNHGGSVQSLVVRPKGGSLSVTLSDSTDVRSFVEACTKELPHLELIRRTAVPKQAVSGLQYEIANLVTEKQLQALHTAYLEGYFEWPRTKTGEEIAASLGVSGPTFQQHIRKGTNRIFQNTFGPDSKERLDE
ncbi:GAF domain-containing protein [Haloprofundus sp. MHR1]|nr:GAF domain-containing protein [Haloprofundus sp. MHR1]